MNTCRNCGSRINEDDVFCTECGARVREDEYNSISKVSKKGTFDYIIQMISKPFTTSCKFTEEGQKNSVMLFTVLAIVIQGILGIWKSNQMLSKLDSFIYSIVDKLKNINILFGKDIRDISPDEMQELQKQINSIKSVIDIPYGKIFFQNCMLIVAAIIVLFISLLLIHSVVKEEKVDSFDIYKISIISLFPFLFMEIISILVSYISNTVGIFALIIGIGATVAILTLLIKNYILQSADGAVYLAPVISTIVIFVILVILGSFIMKNLQEVILNLTTVLKYLNI